MTRRCDLDKGSDVDRRVDHAGKLDPPSLKRVRKFVLLDSRNEAFQAAPLLSLLPVHRSVRTASVVRMLVDRRELLVVIIDPAVCSTKLCHTFQATKLLATERERANSRATSFYCL
jgi:hypothetical protein